MSTKPRFTNFMKRWVYSPTIHYIPGNNPSGENVVSSELNNGVIDANIHFSLFIKWNVIKFLMQLLVIT